jgi:hypothetical protein
MKINSRIIFRRILPILAGGLLGYTYYYFIGCTNGCPIQSSPYLSTIYGAAIGAVFAFPAKKSKDPSV